MIDFYSVGIDLGTTNAVVAYTAITQNKALGLVEILPIGQWVAEGIWQEKILFPTYRYHTAPHESHLIQPLPFPFRPLDQDFAVLYGSYAVKLGAANRGQGVSSAKSWLSQSSRVHRDAREAFLPWGIGEDLANSIGLVSPMLATASYLHYLHAWWNYKFPHHPLSEQSLVITLPASFDEYARDLTLAAAEIAGLGHARFLEEPTAAAYAWFDEHQTNEQAKLKAGVMCVLDVGGGTTDLSLIDFRNFNQPKRLAVGDHLMLGGDNLDAAISQSAIVRMSETEKKKIQLSPAQWSQLMLAARDAKERIFGEEELTEETVTLSLLGRGKSLIAKQRQAILNIVDLKDQLLEGFLPLLEFEDLTPLTQKKGLVEIGLQFEQETAITRHLLQFLQKSNIEIDSLLLNGGFFQAQGFCQRIETQMQRWSQNSWKHKETTVYKTTNTQTAVAIGAVLFCEARRNNTSVISGGAARNLFLALANTQNTESSTDAICVTLKGMPESFEQILPQVLNLAVNTPVQFKLFSSSADENIALGELARINPQWIELPSLQAHIELPINDHLVHQEVQVQLVAELTAIGTLQLQFKSINPEIKLPNSLLEFAGRSSLAGVRLNSSQLPKFWNDIACSLENVYGAKSGGSSDKSKNDKNAFVDLRKKLELLGNRSDWNITVCRSLADLLLKWRKNRRRSARHESFWLNLLAFVMRPGHGVVGDINRMEYIRDVLESVPAYHEYDVWFAWWTLVRRISAGLDIDYQRWLFQTHEAKLKNLMDYLLVASKQSSKPKQTASKKGAKQQLSKKELDLKARAPEAMIRAISSLDLLRGQTWFEEHLLKLLKVDSLGVNQHVIAWSLGQVVNRYPQTQGHTQFKPLDNSIIVTALEEWLSEDWKKCTELGLAASIAAQKHADISIAINDNLRLKVINKLIASQLPQAWIDSVKGSSSTTTLQDALSGEQLPHGLSLISR